MGYTSRGGLELPCSRGTDTDLQTGNVQPTGHCSEKDTGDDSYDTVHETYYYRRAKQNLNTNFQNYLINYPKST